ncbi:MAG: hypothetical protein IKX76_06255, partial [Eubacterium sp.]|nr:hypothetical protein [Eubacterium sp.]
MIKIAVLWIVSIILSYAGMAVKERYSPARRMGDFILTAFLHLLLCLQLAAVYFTGTKTALLSAVLLIAFNYYWFYFTPFYPNSDPAGNGMARGFRSIIITFGAVTYGIVSFFLIRFLVIDGIRFGLYIVLAIAAYIGLYNIWANRRSFISGDSLNSSARWERMSVDDYRKTLLRMDLVEKRDSWEAKELDASPEEMDHWDVYGWKCINIKAADGLPCVLARGDFVYPDGRASLHPMGLEWGCLGYTGERNANDRKPESFIPDTINLVWRDLSDCQTYQIQTELPKELSVYFEDSDRFWLDDIELRIMGKGKVWMFHNRTNQIHNICMDHPLVGTLTNEFDQAAEELILKYK